jgi:MYXO-CTERM domain-containing protein
VIGDANADQASDAASLDGSSEASTSADGSSDGSTSADGSGDGSTSADGSSDAAQSNDASNEDARSDGPRGDAVADHIEVGDAHDATSDTGRDANTDGASGNEDVLEGGGCACDVPGSHREPSWPLALLLAGLIVPRRRRQLRAR